MLLNNLTGTSDFTFENHSTHNNETCERHEFVGVTITLMFITGLILNMTILVLVYRSREVKETRNLYFIGLLIVNILNGLLDFPLFILRLFTCK